MPDSAQRRHTDPSTATLNDVIATDELERRPARPPDFAAENRVLLLLAQAMVQSPNRVLQLLVDEARVLCGADSVGISVLETDMPSGEPAQFRWQATSGGLAPLVNTTLPRDSSPGGSVLERKRTLLMREPAHHFSSISALPIPVQELLLVPFFRDGVVIGTVWLVAHAGEGRFDAEDARLIESLSGFAAAAVQVITAGEAHAETNRERAEFLTMLTHELRNGLAPMSNAVYIIRNSDERARRVQAREILERQIVQLSRLVEDLLDGSRVVSGKLRLDRHVVDLSATVLNATESARNQIEQSGQSLHIAMPAEAVSVQGDGIRLTQVLNNLLSNAAKYGRRGGTVNVRLSREGGNALIQVRDDGVGIERSMLPRIFELFVQVDRSLTRAEGGLGIGLALVKSLVEMHGGRVEARSGGIGAGTEFLIWLPAASEQDD